MGIVLSSGWLSAQEWLRDLCFNAHLGMKHGGTNAYPEVEVQKARVCLMECEQRLGRVPGNWELGARCFLRTPRQGEPPWN